jgi:hypothetical protein
LPARISLRRACRRSAQKSNWFQVHGSQFSGCGNPKQPLSDGRLDTQP